MPKRYVSLILFLTTLVCIVFVYPPVWNTTAGFLNERMNTDAFPPFEFRPFKLGLDIVGGTSLVYQADVSRVPIEEVPDSLAGARDVLERRVNTFGVSEPVVRVAGNNRIIIALAGAKDPAEAIEEIGKTPTLEFRIVQTATGSFDFIDTGLTGQYLERAQLIFDPQTGLPQVQTTFNDEGAKLLETITRQNIGQPLGIFIDDLLISAPVIQNEIVNGSAVVTGEFSVEEARELARNLNAGALPLPINLISQKTIGATLGSISLQKSLKAAAVGLILVALFLIVYYRFAGLVAVFALAFYVAVTLLFYKLFNVTITLAGIAGFILSLGMAVDANILIFSRVREELKKDKSVRTSVLEGFARAWSSIRDSQMTTLIAAFILYAATTSLVRGFALTLSIGILVSMFSATIVTKNYLWLFARWLEKRKYLL